PGMVIAPQPVFDCVEAVQAKAEPGLLVAMTPQGERFSQRMAEEFAALPRILLLCGRYEGFDERVYEGLRPRCVSIGDFVCNGGEVPAMAVIEAVMRLLPGVLGDDRSAAEDSFSHPEWLEYPQYTRPPEFRGMKVPDTLLSGHHGEIARWRAEEARRRSLQAQGRREAGRPDERRTKGNDDVDETAAQKD
ncbi:MAG TPA: tRNA (guanosine(37)-N1)-methyltransferase TrmD, partial [Planctomycetia bacterium]|nr:tRNA (guanosine(37)-N1)-methyltransferase TrmD [Planctomycetia bacterium]